MAEQKVLQAISPILVIDDDPAICKLLNDFLNYHGYGVVTKQNGKDALQWLEENHCDLTLVDLRLPGMEGLELIRKASEDFPDFS